MNPLIESLQGKLIVSCQAYMGEPLRHPETMAQMARAAELGGAAAAIRCQGLSDIAAIKGRVEVPVIGLWKEGHEGVCITPRCAMRAPASPAPTWSRSTPRGRPRPDGRTFEEMVEALRGETLVMADCSCMEDVERGRWRRASTS